MIYNFNVKMKICKKANKAQQRFICVSHDRDTFLYEIQATHKSIKSKMLYVMVFIEIWVFLIKTWLPKNVPFCNEKNFEVIRSSAATNYYIDLIIVRFEAKKKFNFGL